MFLLIVFLICVQITGKSCEINISDCNASIFGDCLLGYKINPWVNCTHSSFCWKAFSDGVCNDVCNNKECLFDGMDCLYKQKISGANNQYVVDKNEIKNQDIRLNGKRRQCDSEFDSYCQRNYQNGFCDQGCNNEQCGWDGLDCLEQNQKNNAKHLNYAELPYVAKGSLIITLDLPYEKILSNDVQEKAKSDERPIIAILRALSQIVGTTLRIKQNFNDGSFVLKPITGENGENMTEVEVIADNRMCEYDCFDSVLQMANYLAAFQARTNELSKEFGQSSKHAYLKSIRATEEPESLVSSKFPTNNNETSSIKTWIMTCLIVIFVGVVLGILIANKEKTKVKSITWFPEGFRLRSSEGSCRSISTHQAAGGVFVRKSLGKTKGHFNKLDRNPDGQEMYKELMNTNSSISHVIYEEPKDPRPWSMQHYEAYGEGKNSNMNSNGQIVLPLPMPSNLKELLHPGLRQTQNIMMQTKAETDQLTNGLLSPPLVNNSGGVDVVGPSGLTPLMVASAFRGATPYCGVGAEELNNVQQNESSKLLENNENVIELMDTHNGPGSAGSLTSTNGNATNSSMIDELISQGASVDKTMENTGETSLHLAARFCRADAVKRLLEAKAACNATDFSGRTPLHSAVASDARGAFEILIRNRATDLNAKSNNGITPLILAVGHCFNSLMTELLNAGADINLTDNSQKSALHWAAMVSNIEGLKVLIEHGANKDAQDKNDQTPLFLAAREGAYECVKVLLESGANKDITDHMDVSPRKIAETRSHKDIVALLDGEIKLNIKIENVKNENNNPNSPSVASSPKKSLNSNENTIKRARKQQQSQQNQTQAKFVTKQPQQRPANASELIQTSAQFLNNNLNNTANVNNTNTFKKGQQIVQQIQQTNPNSSLNQQPPPLPPPRPQLQPVPIKIQKNSHIVNLPPIQNNNLQQQQQNYNSQNLPSQFDYMMHTPLTPTCTTSNNLMMNHQQHQTIQQLTMPNTPNSLPPINSPPCTNHVLLSPNNTVLMSPPHHSGIPNHYLTKPPPYESIANHCTQQISNATYMTTNPMHQQWQFKPEPSYYTIFNTATNNQINQNNNDSSYLTPSPDSPMVDNWSAATSPASNGDWLELQTPQQQHAQTQQQIINNTNNDNNQQQIIMIDQQYSPPEHVNQDQSTIINNEQQNPPTYQASCNQINNQQQQPNNLVVNQQQQANSNNTRQITSTQQAVFL